MESRGIDSSVLLDLRPHSAVPGTCGLASRDLPELALESRFPFGAAGGMLQTALEEPPTSLEVPVLPRELRRLQIRPQAGRIGRKSVPEALIETGGLSGLVVPREKVRGPQQEARGQRGAGRLGGFADQLSRQPVLAGVEIQIQKPCSVACDLLDLPLLQGDFVRQPPGVDVSGVL